MDWLNQGDFGEVDRLRQELDQKTQELERLRSSSHQQHNKNAHQTSLLREELQEGKVPDADELMNNWDWNKIADIGQTQSKEKKEVSDDKEDGIKFKSKKELDDWFNRKLQKHEQTKANHVVQAQQTQQQLIEKFTKEHPELIPHSETVQQLWEQSVQLNSGIPADQRFKGVVEQTKKLLSSYNLLPQPGEQQREVNPNAMLVDRGNPYMGQNPLPFRDMSRGVPERVELYDPNQHRVELQKRRESIASKMFS